MITESIIKSAQTGNSDAFAIIYNETIKTAYYVAKRILIDEDATEDVLQEAYISVFPPFRARCGGLYPRALIRVRAYGNR